MSSLSAPDARRGGPRDFIVSAVIGTVASLPVFLVGTLALEIRKSLHFGTDMLGITVAAYYLGAAAASLPGGRLSEQVGGIRVMRNSVLLLTILLLTINFAVDSLAALIVVMVLCGLIGGALQPALNLFLARRVTPDSQGLAFGIKQAAIPLSSALGGMAVPAIALTIGWRQAFGAAALIAVISYVFIPKPRRTVSDSKSGTVANADIRIPKNALMILAAAIAFGMLAASGLSSFWVTFAVQNHMSKASAGWVAGVAGMLTVAARVSVGIVADKRQKRHFVTISWMLFAGALGYAMLFLGNHTGQEWLIVIGMMTALGIGWGWNGLFNYAVVKNCATAPARATGVTQVGGRLGAVVGPLVVGFSVTHGSFNLAWAICGVSMLFAGMLMLLGRHLLMKYNSEDLDYQAAALIASPSAG